MVSPFHLLYQRVEVIMVVVVFVFTLSWAIALLAFAYHAAWIFFRAEPEPRRLLVAESSARFGSIQHRELKLPMSYHHAFSVCFETLQVVPGAVLKKMSRDEGVIDAKVGLTWRSWGLDISMELIPMEEKETFLRLVCQPAMRSTLVDYGQSHEVVERILLALEQRCHERHLLPPAGALGYV